MRRRQASRSGRLWHGLQLVLARHVKMESGVNFPLGGLLLTVGPLTLSEDQFAQVKFVGSATSFISHPPCTWKSITTLPNKSTG